MPKTAAATINNYQPPCSNPVSARVSNAAGWTLCATCPEAAWHETKHFDRPTPLESPKPLTITADFMVEPAKPEPVYIDCTPVGLQTPEGCRRVDKAKSEWDTAAHCLCNTLSEMLDESVAPLSRDDLHQLLALLGVRDRKQEAFLRAVAGAPEMN